MLPHEPVALRPGLLRFGPCELLPLERRLVIGGRRVAVGSRAFDLLLVLAERAGRLVTKDQLLDLVWPDAVVEEGNLAHNVSTIRKFPGPVLVIHGRDDRIVPWQQARALASASARATYKLYDCGPVCWDPDRLPFWQDAMPFLREAGIL